MKSLLDLVAPATGARRGARKKAQEFGLTVKPGVTYWSVVENRASWPGCPKRFLMEWVFTPRGRWIGQNARCGHLTAEGAWLGYGPLHETRPPGLMAHAEFSSSPDIFEAEKRIRRGDLVPAGV